MNQCPFCGGAVEDQRVEHVHRWQGRLYLLRNVPAEVCTQCGEVFFGPSALRQMDEVVVDRQRPEGEISVPIYSLR